MLTRRSAIALGTVLSFPAVAAEDWRAKYPEIRFAVIPSENDDGASARWAPLMTFLSQELGVKVTLRPATDYAAVIEGQRNGHLEVGYYGSAAFARALLSGVRTEAFAVNVNKISGRGYYSVFWVLAKSPYHRIEDLKGRNLGLVDPNSTSGYQVPLFTLDKMGVDPDKYFARSVFAGSHENAITALVQGTVDVAANSYSSAEFSNLVRMLNKGMLKHPDGTPMRQEDFRIVMQSPMIPSGPYTYLADLPEAMKADIRAAFFAAPTKAKAAFDRIADGQNAAWEPIANKDYDEIIALIKFVDALRKKRS